MAFLFYIDSQLTDQPDNGMELVTTIRRDTELNGFLTTQDAVLTWAVNDSLVSGEISGYTYLKNLFNSGSCGLSTIEIRDEISFTQTRIIFTGVISAANIVIQEQGQNLQCKIDDNNYYSFIKNNSKVEFSTYATKTKNGLTVVPPPVYEVNMFDSATGALLGSPGNYWKGYRLCDILAFLIPAISDNKVTFQSDYLTSDISGIQLFLFDGFSLRTAGANPSITTCFDKIITELFKLKNLGFYIDQSDPAAPIFRLENKEWFFVGSNILTFDNPLELKTSIKNSKIYGTIRTGSDYNPGGANPAIYTWQAGTSYFGWKNESFTPLGQCNTDQELNLVNEYIIASNAIQDQVVGLSSSHDASMFIIECWLVDTTLLTAQATDYDTYATAPERFYNIGLNNLFKLSYHGSSLQGALTNTADAGIDIFRAIMGSENYLMDETPGSPLQSTFGNNPAVVVPVPFANENTGGAYDPGNNYNNLLYHYIAPTSGNYSFSANLHAEILNLKTCTTTGNNVLDLINIPTQYGVIITISIEAYSDNTFTTLVAAQNFNQLFSINGTYNLQVALAVPLLVGAAVRVRSQCQWIIMFPTLFGPTPLTQVIIDGGTCGYAPSDPKGAVIALEDSYFECNGTPEGGLILTQPDPSAYRVRQHEFEHDISATDFATLQGLPIGRFEFIKDGVSRFGWIEELVYNNWTTRAKIKLITQDATI